MLRIYFEIGSNQSIIVIISLILRREVKQVYKWAKIFSYSKLWIKGAKFVILGILKI